MRWRRARATTDLRVVYRKKSKELKRLERARVEPRKSWSPLQVAHLIVVLALAVVAIVPGTMGWQRSQMVKKAGTGGGGGGTTITCNQSSTSTGDLATDLGAISNGQTLCLTQAIDYGTLPDTTKAITIIAQSATGARSPVNASITLDVRTNDANWTLDGNHIDWTSHSGLTIGFALFRDITSPANITIKNFMATGCGAGASDPNPGCHLWSFDPSPTNSGILIDNGVFHDNYTGEAVLYFDDAPAAGCQDSGIVVQNSLFINMVNDGIKFAGCDGATIQYNFFYEFDCVLGGWTANDCGADGSETPGTNHTDGIQFFNEPGSTSSHVVRGNWLKKVEQCYFGDDGTSLNLIEFNVADDCITHWITLGGDSPGSIVRGNTMAQTTGYRFVVPNIACGGTDAATPVSLTSIYNNVAQDISTGGTPNCNPTINSNNYCTTSCGAGNTTGSAPDYVGYNQHATIAQFDEFSDFCLDTGSGGKGISRAYGVYAAGGDTGVCGPGGYPTIPGPPAAKTNSATLAAAWPVTPGG